MVAVGGLVWGVVGSFIAKPEAAKPPSAAAPPTVSVSGSGNIGIGTMTGGQIAMGAPTTPAAAAAPQTAGSTP